MKTKIMMIISALLFSSFGTANQKMKATAPDYSPTGNTTDVEAGRAFDRSTEQRIENMESMDVTKQIRAELASNRKLSRYAKNVDILIDKDEITFVGPIKAQSERQAILDVATRVAPTYSVKDKLVISK